MLTRTNFKRKQTMSKLTAKIVGWGSPQLALSVVLTTLLLANTASAQTCKTDSITATTPDSRFEILAGGSEVKDKRTGLIWQRCSLRQTWDGSTCTGTAKSYNWQQALSQAQALGNGYRLPNIKELQSIVEQQCYNPAINTTRASIVVLRATALRAIVNMFVPCVPVSSFVPLGVA